MTQLTHHIVTLTICLVALWMPGLLSAEDTMQNDSVHRTGKTTLIYLDHSETLQFDEVRLPDAQILKGDVCFRHDSALMYCDSAYFYEKENSLSAFGHVHMVQGDSVEGFGDLLFYDGNTRIARLRRHGKLVHQGMTITTDSLNYDRARNIAYYFSGGQIQDSLNTLTSSKGQYTPNDNQAVFYGNVHLVNNKFTLDADTLHYNTHTYRTDLTCPTQIVYEQETTIYSSDGWYNTHTEKGELFHRSRIVHVDGESVTGDTIYYDKKQGYGLTLGNIVSIDSTNHLTLTGDKSELWERDEHGYVTHRALLHEWGDSIHSFMHADTIFTEAIPYRAFTLIPKDSILVDSVMRAQVPDTLWKDTTYRQVRGYYRVRVYRSDMQAVADSLRYNGRDSIMSLYGLPICWNEQNQVSADSIHVYVKNGEVDYIHGLSNAIAIKQESRSAFDQLGGKEMIAYIKDQAVYLVDVKGNAETIFYPREEDGTFIGMNRTQSSYVKLYIENKTIHHVVFTPATTGIMYPMSDVNTSNAQLAAFFWADSERPYRPMDVLLTPERVKRPEAAVMSASDEEEEETVTTTTSRSPKSKSKKQIIE